MSKADQTRAFIIEKTAPVFNQKGYAGTSLTDLTTATGLSKGSIYGNFGSKDEVALAVFDHNLQKLESVISAEMSKYTTAKEQLLAYAGAPALFLKFPEMRGGCPILNTATEADDTHPALKEKAKAAILSRKNKLVKLIEKGQQNGEFNPGGNAEEAALTIIAAVEGCIMIARLTGRLQHMKLVTEGVKKIIENLV